MAQSRLAGLPPVFQAATKSALPPDSGTASNGAYTIGPADVLTVMVLREASLSGNLLVRPDGMISMPLLGDVKAAGANPRELANDIAERLKKYIQDPNVTVVVSQINSRKAYLIGEVNKVGPVDITNGMTLLEAISSAGGLTQYANVRKIYVLRKQSAKDLRIPIQYKQALKGDRASNVVVQPGDTIVVP
ncbi:MAG TPA: polysaccharide biosynthesis/export family protein [Terracidiphilus sp.]